MAGSWAPVRRAAAESADMTTSLPAEVVDAAFADESIGVEPVRHLRRDIASRRSTDSGVVEKQNGYSEGNDLLQSLSDQLAMLQTQQENLQRLLASPSRASLWAGFRGLG